MIDFESVKIGDRSEATKRFTEHDVRTFAEITGDTNPVHLDAAFAKESIFGKQIVHGMLVSSLFSKIFGTQFPGNGCIYIAQTLKFIKPVFIDDEVKSEVQVVEINKEKRRLIFETKAYVCNQPVITGTAKILIPEQNT